MSESATQASDAPIKSAPQYKTNARIAWYRSPIDKTVLAELMQKSDLRGAIHVTLQIGLFITTGLLAYAVFRMISPANWYWTVPLLYVALFAHGTGGPFMGLVSVHELVHRTPFKTKALNEIFLTIYSFLSWSDYIWFRPSHIKHHQVTVHTGYDGEVTLPQVLTLKNREFWLGLVAWNPKLTWNTIRNFAIWSTGEVESGTAWPGWYSHVIPRENETLRRKHRNWARTVLYGHLALAAVFIATGHWFLIIVFTIGTQYCGWLGLLLGMPQHYGMRPSVPDFRLCCRTYTCSWLPGFYYWNMQYHVEHHMYPGVPFFNLPKLRKALEHDLPPVHHGIVATWREMLEIHHRQKDDPNYCLVPDLPEPNAT